MPSSIYRAVEVTSPGNLELVERVLSEPGPGHVRLRVEAAFSSGKVSITG
jgi:hypothetical protein